MPSTKPLIANDLSYAALKQQHRLVRDAHPASLTLRIHRALSWLNRAEQAQDTDGKFIFLWIAFNAAYAQQLNDSEYSSDRVSFTAFLKKLYDLDSGKRIDNLIWHEFSGSIRLLLDNPYVFPLFWEFQCGRISQHEWQNQFLKAKKSAHSALASSNTPMLLSLIFSRLYTLRNQLVHGGATWGGRINRDQLRDCSRLLGQLVPVIITLMMSNPNALWGDAVYPVVDQDDQAKKC